MAGPLKFILPDDFEIVFIENFDCSWLHHFIILRNADCKIFRPIVASLLTLHNVCIIDRIEASPLK